MDELKKLKDTITSVIRVCQTIPTRAATLGVNFTKERFREQNWLDQTAKPWQKRKQKKHAKKSDSRKVLVKSGRLRRSWRKIYANQTMAVIGTDVEYAQIHNDGGKIKTVSKVGSYQKKAYNRKASTRERNGKRERVKAHTVMAHQVKAHRRKINITIPQRQMIGNSATLKNKIKEMVIQVIENAIKE